MDRTGERRNGADRRRRVEIVLPWQDPVWDTGWDRPERRTSDRRGDGDRRHVLPRTDELEWYSDDWARARGAPSFNAWLDQSAKQLPLGLPGGAGQSATGFSSSPRIAPVVTTSRALA